MCIVCSGHCVLTIVEICKRTILFITFPYRPCICNSGLWWLINRIVSGEGGWGDVCTNDHDLVKLLDIPQYKEYHFNKQDGGQWTRSTKQDGGQWTRSTKIDNIENHREFLVLCCSWTFKSAGNWKFDSPHLVITLTASESKCGFKCQNIAEI